MSRKKIKVSTHARIRARERLDVHHHTNVNKELNNAITYGHPLADYEGDFAKFLQYKKQRNRTNVGIKVYKDNIVIYRNKTIITAYAVPERFIPTDNYLRINYVNNPYLKKLIDLVGKDNIEYQVFPPPKVGKSYVTGLYVNDMFEGFGIGTTEDKSINHICRAYIRRNFNEGEGEDDS